MPETKSPLRLVRFGTFEADLRTGELRKDGVRLKFSGQPFQVLAILLERPGEVVTREELQKRLWPDTFVDVERNLNTAINKIREVLGDSAETPRFIETLPRRGYRFVGELEAPLRPAVPVVTVEPDHGSHREWRKIGAGLLAILIIALAAFGVYRWHRQQPPQEKAALTAVPFTALPGMAFSPAFSPDGSRIAFAWSPRLDANGSRKSDLYVKALGSETLLRLTQHPSTALIPAWSPDGTQIAFYRRAGADSGIYVVPALGGPEQKLRSTKDQWNLTISWSPDGKWIAFADESPEGDHLRIYLISPETLAAKQIPINPHCLEERLPAFSHNGNYLAYWCFQNDFQASLYFLSLPDGKPQVITRFLEDNPSGLTWSADDKKLIYSRWKRLSSDELREVVFASGSATQLGLEGMSPAVSSKGDKLAYASPLSTHGLWQRDLLQPGVPAGEVVPSSRPQYDAQYSPDGKRIVFASERSGVRGVWISNEDGSSLVQISDPMYVSGSPQWSPDGNKVAFDSLHHDNWEIDVADVAELKPIKLVTNVSHIIRPNWSRDGKWIYFVSHEPGREGVYRCPASGGDAARLSKDIHPFNPKESFDGKAVYFASGQSVMTLKKVALPGQPGSESDVDPSLRVSHSQNWQLSSTGIYFVPAEAPRSVRYFDLVTKQIRPIFDADKDFSRGLSVSPDGRWFLYSLAGDESSDIMIVDHFR
jgi:Tol biopolymer transport system component/DNA-binding winged helix-turn-helix (wHTH) protein